jgi:hypothetical protein
LTNGREEKLERYSDAEQLVSVFQEASKNFPFIFLFKKTAKNCNNRSRM